MFIYFSNRFWIKQLLVPFWKVLKIIKRCQIGTIMLIPTEILIFFYTKLNMMNSFEKVIVEKQINYHNQRSTRKS